jgi:hypothetical protein
MKKDPANNSFIPFRIRLGVTGHRKLTNEAKLRETVREFLDGKFRDLLDARALKLIDSPKGIPVAFSILTPLAEGADRLVAREVLGDKEGRMPSRIEVVLPLEKSDYLRDFDTEESRREFNELLDLARRPVSLRTKSLDNEFPGDNQKETREQMRKNAYRNVGRYVVDHCDVLIAIWDGQDSRGKGGTKEIIDYARSRKRPIWIISSIDFSGKLEKGEGLYSKTVEYIHAYNTFPVPAGEREAYINNCWDRFFKNKEGSAIPQDMKQAARTILLGHYIRASLMAKHYQKIYKTVGPMVYAFSAAAVAAIAIGTLVPHLANWAFGLELFLLAAILVSVMSANRRRVHKKWIESRYLAERIRSAVFFAACGMEVSPLELPPFMRIAHNPNDWMVKIFNETWNRMPEMPGCDAGRLGSALAYIRKHWIRDQIEYHKDKSEKTRRMSRMLETGGTIAFIAALCAAFCHLLFSLLSHSGFAERYLVFLAIVFPSLGAAVGGIRAHHEYSRLEKRSSAMHLTLCEIDESFESDYTPEAFDALMREIEELMLRETQDWLMLLKFAKLETAI